MEAKEMKVDGSDKNEKTAQPNGKPKTAEEMAADSLKSQINKMADQFQNALPNKIGVERMMRIVMTAILNNPTLALCEPHSFFGALLQSLQLGLEVNTPLGQAYLIPRKKKDKQGNYYWACNFQLGYQGLLDLCYRYGKYRQITAEIVHEGDDFDFQLGTAQFLRHNPKGKSEKPTFVWALYELDNGGQRFVVWTWNQVIKHAEQFSDSYATAIEKKWDNSSPWTSSQESKESMAQKTVLHDLLKHAPKSVELHQAVSADENTIMARAVNEGGETRFQFDIEQQYIEDDRDNENRVREKAPGAEKPEKEKAPIAAGKPKAEKASAAAPPPEQSPANEQGNEGKPKSGLFSDDEERAMEEQYNRQGPNFGD
jgi:recombination protein RecT